MGLRDALRSVLLLPGASFLFTPFTRGCAVVFLLHRFRDVASGVDGTDAIDPQAVRRALEYLRRKRYDLVPLTDVLRRLNGEGPPLDRTIAFTMDDGYWEQAAIAGPLFAEFDCPITAFVTTDFLDGNMWLWNDLITYVLRNTRVKALEVTMGGSHVALRLGTEVELETTRAALMVAAKTLHLDDRTPAVAELGRVCEVEIPRTPPPAYAPMTWDDARKLERGSMRFGPHSVTHSILSLASDEESEREIAASWARVSAEVADPVPVFCYPNGEEGDFGPREIATLRRLGLNAAVTGVWGYANGPISRADPDARYHVPRVGLPIDRASLVYLTGGAGRLRERLRSSAEPA